MSPQDNCGVEIIISGEAKTIMPHLLISPLKDAVNSVRFHTMVCMPPSRASEQFWLPYVKKRESSKAMEALEGLLQEQSIDDDKFEKISEYINLARIIWR